MRVTSEYLACSLIWAEPVYQDSFHRGHKILGQVVPPNLEVDKLPVSPGPEEQLGHIGSLSLPLALVQSQSLPQVILHPVPHEINPIEWSLFNIKDTIIVLALLLSCGPLLPLGVTDPEKIQFSSDTISWDRLDSEDKRNQTVGPQKIIMIIPEQCVAVVFCCKTSLLCSVVWDLRDVYICTVPNAYDWKS